MKKKKQKNPVDEMLESIIEKIGNIPNIDMIQTDVLAKRMFEFSVKRFGGIINYKHQVNVIVLPALNRSGVETKNHIRNSQYKALQPLLMEEVEENTHEMMRILYTGVFHKYENFMRELVELSNEMVKDLGRPEINKYAKDNFGQHLIDWQKSNAIYRINWLTNCIKHKDSFPVKDNPPIEYIMLPHDKKIVITKDDFVKDIDILVEEMIDSIQMAKLMVGHIITFGDPDPDREYSIEMKAKKEVIDQTIRGLISNKKAQPAIHIPEVTKKLIKDTGYEESGWINS